MTIDTDTRVVCQTCRHLFTRGAGLFCVTHRAAFLTTRDLAADFTLLPQRCPAWSAKP